MALLVALEVAADPRPAMAGEAHRLHRRAPFLLLLGVDQEVGGRGAVQRCRQRHTVLVDDLRGVRVLRVSVGVHESEDPPGDPVLHPVGALGDGFAVRGDQEADVAGGAGRGGEVRPTVQGTALKSQSCFFEW